MIYRRSHPAFASAFDRAVEHMLHCDRMPRVVSAEPKGMKIGGAYNWKGQTERLKYLGRNWSGNGYWHQFEKIDEPGVVWCEVLDGDLHMIEETKTPNVE